MRRFPCSLVLEFSTQSCLAILILDRIRFDTWNSNRTSQFSRNHSIVHRTDTQNTNVINIYDFHLKHFYLVIQQNAVGTLLVLVRVLNVLSVSITKDQEELCGCGRRSYRRVAERFNETSGKRRHWAWNYRKASGEI
jgi:hypothetical protein